MILSKQVERAMEGMGCVKVRGKRTRVMFGDSGAVVEGDKVLVQVPLPTMIVPRILANLESWVWVEK